MRNLKLGVDHEQKAGVLGITSCWNFSASKGFAVMRPILCNYYLTYRRNAKCGFCDIWEKPSPMADPADVEKNLTDLRRLGVRVIDFTGGEPLLHTGLHRFLSKAKELGFITSLTSNGLLYPKRADQLAGLVDMLHFSIDSSDAEEHDKSRGVKCFDRLMVSIETALRLGENPDLHFTVTNENVDRLEEIYERFSLPNKLILIINPLFEYHDLGHALNERVMDRVEKFAQKPYTYLNPALLELRRRGGNDPLNPVCKAVSSCVVISPSNELILPCYHAGFEQIPIEGGLYDLWHSDIVAGQKQLQGRHPECSGCTINCYFEPSFATSPMSTYFWMSLPSKTRYAWTKFVVQRLRSKLTGSRAAILPPVEDWITKPTGDGAATDKVPVFEESPLLSTNIEHHA